MDRVEPHGMQGHVIVCGLQGVELRAVEQFHLSGTQVVVIDDDTDPRFSRILGDWGVAHVRRHAHRGEGFEDAGLERSAAVVCVEVDEIHTLETALRVKEIRPELPLVVQLTNPSMAQALERVSGPGSVLDVAALAAPSFVEACLGRPAHAIELAGIDFAVVQLGVEGIAAAHDTFRGEEFERGRYQRHARELSKFYVDLQPFLVAGLGIAPGPAARSDTRLASRHHGAP